MGKDYGSLGIKVVISQEVPDNEIHIYTPGDQRIHKIIGIGENGIEEKEKKPKKRVNSRSKRHKDKNAVRTKAKDTQRPKKVQPKKKAQKRGRK